MQYLDILLSGPLPHVDRLRGLDSASTSVHVAHTARPTETMLSGAAHNSVNGAPVRMSWETASISPFGTFDALLPRVPAGGNVSVCAELRVGRYGHVAEVLADFQLDIEVPTPLLGNQDKSLHVQATEESWKLRGRGSNGATANQRVRAMLMAPWPAEWNVSTIAIAACITVSVAILFIAGRCESAS